MHRWESSCAAAPCVAHIYVDRVKVLFDFYIFRFFYFFGWTHWCIEQNIKGDALMVVHRDSSLHSAFFATDVLNVREWHLFLSFTQSLGAAAVFAESPFSLYHRLICCCVYIHIHPQQHFEVSVRGWSYQFYVHVLFVFLFSFRFNGILATFYLTSLFPRRGPKQMIVQQFFTFGQSIKLNQFSSLNALAICFVFETRTKQLTWAQKHIHPLNEIHENWHHFF